MPHPNEVILVKQSTFTPLIHLTDEYINLIRETLGDEKKIYAMRIQASRQVKEFPELPFKVLAE